MNACMEAHERGHGQRDPGKKPEGPVDVTLEDMKKKKEKED